MSGNVDEEKGSIDEERGSMAVRCPCGTNPTDPGEGMMGFRAAEGTNVCFSTVGMGADGVGDRKSVV